MPSRSDRHLLINDIDQLIKTLVVNASPIPDSRLGKDIDELLAIRACLQSSRYLDLRKYVKQKRTMADLLYSYDDKGFKAEVRMDKSSFTKTVEILSRNPVFHNNSRNRQTYVWVQCFVVFRRLGCHGNGNSMIRNAHQATAGVQISETLEYPTYIR